MYTNKENASDSWTSLVRMCFIYLLSMSLLIIKVDDEISRTSFLSDHYVNIVNGKRRIRSFLYLSLITNDDEIAVFS